MAVVGAVLILGYIGVALSAPILYRADPAQPDLQRVLKAPSATDLLGTDELGRSILGRIVWGSRISLMIAFTVVAVGMLIGIPIGLISGYYGGRVDFVIQRLTDLLLAFPGFLLALALIAVLGAGFANTVISVAISMVPQYIRLVRGCSLSVREQLYVEAARALGMRDFKILLRHILPNVMVPIIVQTTLNLGVAILFAAGLGFLGVGIQPPTPEWGTMLGTGRIYIFKAPHVATFPGLAIFFAVLGFNLLGDGLRDALDPRFKM
jgi:ABC-type dipeptide/oligopeptide/nickel transport system permease subunit